MKRGVRTIVGVLCALLLVRFAVAETARVRLKDGREFEGTVVAETPYKIVLQALISNISTEMTFTLADVASVERSFTRAAPVAPTNVPDAAPAAGTDVDDDLEPPTVLVEDIIRLEAMPTDQLFGIADAGGVEARYIAAMRMLTVSNDASSFDRGMKWLRQAASASHREACYELGRITRAGTHGVLPNETEALRHFAAAAARGHAEAMRECVEILLRGQTHNRSPRGAVKWLKKLVMMRDVDAHEDLYRIDPAAYVGVCAPSSGAALTTEAGRALRISGTLSKKGLFGWVVDCRDGFVNIDPGGIDIADALPGRAVVIYGPVLRDREVRALSISVPQPSYKYEYELDTRGGVAAGSTRSWAVRVTVRNTGPQPLKEIAFSVRCWQTSSPNDETDELVVRGVPAGETAGETVSFTFYNYQYIAPSSVPRVEVRVRSIEW